MRMPFGKYKDKPIEELPDSYLEWLASLSDLRSRLRDAVTDEMNERAARRHGEIHSSCPDTEIAKELISAGLRALAQKHHPDHGGSHDKMIMVNSVAEWLRKQI